MTAVGTITTSVKAHGLAQKLVAEYNVRKAEEKNLNVRLDDPEGKTGDPDDPRRKVTQIDYQKHESTVKELDRQEEEEQYQRKKEEAAQWCTLDHEHGPNCRRPVGGCSHDHQKEWAIYEKTTEEKIRAADRFRQEGNEAYRKHNFGLAAVHYRKALLQFDYTFADTPAEEQSLEAVKVPCLLNLAACKCQQEEWDEVLTHTRLALEINPRSVKAFYRQGLAYLARDQFDEAKDTLMSAHEIEPHNSDVLGALRRLKENMANYKVRQKEVYKEMVASANAEEPAGEVPAANDEHPQTAAAPAAACNASDPAGLPLGSADHGQEAGRILGNRPAPQRLDVQGSASSEPVRRAGQTVQFGCVQYEDTRHGESGHREERPCSASSRSEDEMEGEESTGGVVVASRSSVTSSAGLSSGDSEWGVGHDDSIGSVTSMANVMNGIAGNSPEKSLRRKPVARSGDVDGYVRSRLQAAERTSQREAGRCGGADARGSPANAASDVDSEDDEGVSAAALERARRGILFAAGGFAALAAAGWLFAFGAGASAVPGGGGEL